MHAPLSLQTFAYPIMTSTLLPACCYLNQRRPRRLASVPDHDINFMLADLSPQPFLKSVDNQLQYNEPFSVSGEFSNIQIYFLVHMYSLHPIKIQS
jgi:hypothetical protein